MIVLDKNGVQGTLAQAEPFSPDGESQMLVRFENGRQVVVPREMLIRHEDGHYHLPVSIEELIAAQEGGKRKEILQNVSASDVEELVIPVVDEELRVQKQARHSGVVEIRKTVHERIEVVDQPLQSEEVEVQRIPVNRIVEGPLQIRHEGNTMIVPLLEEVLVVEKRLLLREEVHIRKLRKEVHEPQEVLLREERVEIVRKADSGQSLPHEETRR
jgi:uncharacterized protein (TIGR02271 family)